MNEPIIFENTTRRFGLPYLFSGQAQKEFFVNEALSSIDRLLHPMVAGVLSAPPPDPADGDAWIVGSAASGVWAGKEAYLAFSAGQSWNMVSPQPGMQVYDARKAQFAVYTTEWKTADAPPTPQSGTVIDAQLRQAFTELIESLKTVGIFGVTPAGT